MITIYIYLKKMISLSNIHINTINYLYQIDKEFNQFYNKTTKFKDAEDFLIIFLLIFPFITFPFSPILSSIIIFFNLSFFSNIITDKIRKLLGLLFIICNSIVWSSRERFIEKSDDMNYYYNFYLNLSSDITDLNGMVWNDFLFYFSHKIIRVLLSTTLTVDFFLFLYPFISSILFFYWLEKFIIKKSLKKNRALLLSISLFYFDFFMSTQAVRQMISIPILLVAYYSGLNKKGLLSFIIASFIHSSSIIIILYLFLSKLKLQYSLLILFTFFILLAFFQDIYLGLYSLSIIPNISIFKVITSYLTMELRRDHIEFFWALIKIPFFSLFGFLFFWSKKYDQLKNFFFLLLISYFLLYNYPYAPFRIAMPILFVMGGLMKFFSLYKIINIYRTYLILMLLNFFRIQFFVNINNPSLGFNLYYSFPIYSFTPFYYIKGIIGF
jgi:hypothetical protein